MRRAARGVAAADNQYVVVMFLVCHLFSLLLSIT
jgi:hypothetical protein